MEVHGNNNNGPVTIEDEIDVIDLDAYLKDNEEAVLRWDRRIQDMILEDLIGGNEQQLEKFLEQYKKSLKEEASSFTNQALVKEKFLGHLKSIYFCCSHLLFKKPHWTPYVEQYENLLAEYCTLELYSVQRLKRKRGGKDYTYEKVFVNQCCAVYHSLCTVLSVCLQNSERHILHVLLKLRFSAKSPACREIMHGIFSYFMIDLPQKDYSDEAFCRYFLAMRRWQQIRSDSHATMEKIMYLRMNRTDDCIKNDKNIQKILGIYYMDATGIFSLITDNIDVSKNAYFTYIRQNKGAIREYESDCSLQISSDDDPNVVVLSDDDDDDRERGKDDDDDDVEIVQVIGPTPIDLGDDEGGVIGPPEKSRSQPEPVVSTEKLVIEEVAKEQTALIVEESEEEVLNYQLEEVVVEKSDNGGVQNKETTNTGMVVEDVVASMEEVVENEEAVARETSKNVSTSEIEDEEEILERFNDVAIEKVPTEERSQSEEMDFSKIETEEVVVETNGGECGRVPVVEVEMNCKEVASEKEEVVVERNREEFRIPVETNFKEIATEVEEVVVETITEECGRIPVEEVKTNFNEVAIPDESLKGYPRILPEAVANTNVAEEQLHFNAIASEQIEIIQPEQEEIVVTANPSEELHFNEISSEHAAVLEENTEELTGIQSDGIPSVNESEEMHFSAVDGKTSGLRLVEVVSLHDEKAFQTEEGKTMFPTEQMHFNAVEGEDFQEIAPGEAVYFEQAPQFEETVVSTHGFLPQNVGENVTVISLPTADAFNVQPGFAPCMVWGLTPPQQQQQEGEALKPSSYAPFSISSLIDEGDEKKKAGGKERKLQEGETANLHNILCVDKDTKMATVRFVQVVEKDGVAHILDNGVLTSMEDIPVTDAESVGIVEEEPQPQEKLEPPPLLYKQEVVQENLMVVAASPDKLEQPPPVLYKQEPATPNGTKLKPALKQQTTPPTPTNGLLTGRISYTSRETLNVPRVQPLHCKEEDLVYANSIFSAPVNNGGGVVEYLDEGKGVGVVGHNNGGVLVRSSNSRGKRAREGERATRQKKRTRFAKEEVTCYQYASGSEYGVRGGKEEEVVQAQAQAHAQRLRWNPVSFAENRVNMRDSKLRERNKRAEIIVPEMSLTKMRALIEKRKRECFERAANRLKGDTQRRPLDIPKEKPPHHQQQPQQQPQQPQPQQQPASLIQCRFDYKTDPKTTPGAAQRLGNPPQQSSSSSSGGHETTPSTPSVWPETTIHGKQKGNRSVGLKKTSIASRRRTKVNGESVSKQNMDVVFDSLINGTDSSLKSKKGDKT